MCVVACSPERRPTGDQTAGGDDYPNAVDALGKKSASSLNDSTDWNSAFSDMPDSVPGLYDTASVPESAQSGKSKPLSKFAASMISVTIPIIPDDSLLKPDSLLDSVKTVVDSTDGTTTVIRTRYTDTVTIQDSVVTLPNLLLASRFIKTAGADTLEVWELLDGDGDGAVLDYSLDSNVVDWVRSRLVEGADVLEITTRVRLAAFPESGRNYVIYFFEEKVMRDGGRITLEISGSRSDSTFRPGERAYVTRTNKHPDNDISEKTLRLTVDLDAQAGSFESNRLAAVQTQEYYRRGDWESFRLLYTPDDPIPAGKSAIEGTVEATLMAPSEEAFSFSGRRMDAGWEGAVAGPDNRIWKVRFSPQGAVISAVEQ